MLGAIDEVHLLLSRRKQQIPKGAVYVKTVGISDINIILCQLYDRLILKKKYCSTYNIS